MDQAWLFHLCPASGRSRGDPHRHAMHFGIDRIAVETKLNSEFAVLCTDKTMIAHQHGRPRAAVPNGPSGNVVLSRCRPRRETAHGVTCSAGGLVFLCCTATIEKSIAGTLRWRKT
nr:hypothetical protein CFP56_04007 [Quercus suber]